MMSALESFESTASDDDYFLNVPNTARLYIVYTLTCNYSCSHCLVGSNPLRKEKMALETAKTIIRSAAACGYQVIYLTGGEVFLYYKELCELVSTIAAAGRHSVVETNGAWAVDARRARKKLEKLKSLGLGCVAVSIDRYHLEYGTVEPCLRVARAATEIGLPCRTLVVASPDRAADKAILDRLTAENVPYFYETLMAVGRGANVKGAGQILQKGKCDSVGATVFSDGSVISCAGAMKHGMALKNIPLYAGNVMTSDPNEIFRREQTNPFARAIDEFGHDYLESLLSPELKSRFQAQSRCLSLCEYCHNMLGDTVVVDALRTELNQ
jgi:hypothetical protein